MATVQQDLVSTLAGGARFVELIERRLSKDQNVMYSVMDVAVVFSVSDTKVREWIEDGRLCGANMNAGMTCPVNPDKPDGERRPLRPLWRMTRAAIMDMAAHMEAGV
jgi:hypothetical protein